MKMRKLRQLQAKGQLKGSGMTILTQEEEEDRYGEPQGTSSLFKKKFMNIDTTV